MIYYFSCKATVAYFVTGTDQKVCFISPLMSIRIAATCRLRIHVTCRLYATCVIAYTMNLLILASVLLRGPYLYTAFFIYCL